MNKHCRQIRTLLFVTFAFLVTLTLGACETDQPETEIPAADSPATGQQMPPAEQDTGQGMGGMAEAEEIEGDPSEYMGQTVRVDGEVAEVFGQNSFTLQGDWLGSNLLVVVPQDVGGGETFNQGDNVQVTGDVQEYVATDLETEYGVDLGGVVDYEEQEPVVIAQEVTPGVAQQPAE